MAGMVICNLVFNVKVMVIASGSYWNCHALDFLRYNPLPFPVQTATTTSAFNEID